MAGILNSTLPRFPNHINIISWNYDYEIEKAYTNYSLNIDKIEDVYKELNVFHKYSLQPFPSEKSFKVLKINGSIGYRYGANKENFVLGLEELLKKKDGSVNIMPTFSTLFTNHQRFSDENLDPAISFAWEGSISENRIISEAVNVMRDTNVLVVIGYSFPFFNRQVDKLLLNENNARKLEKIYVQDSDPSDIIEIMKGFRNNWMILRNAPDSQIPTPMLYDIPFIPIRHTNQFWMPHEL